MPDVFTKAKRSQVMSLIRSRGNKATELALALLLRANGITGWRRHVRIKVTGGRGDVTGKVTGGKGQVTREGEGEMTGRKTATGKIMSPGTRHLSLSVRPDFVFRKARVAVFVDGCFWHGCPKHGNLPANNRAFWSRKLAGNRRRDRLVNRTLRRAGWRVVRVWQCALAKRPVASLRRVEKVLNHK